MKFIGTVFIIAYYPLILLGQTCQTEEIKLRYSNGFEVFNICATNPTFKFDEKKEYFWYTEFSNIKSTKGGCGGKLLHGNYKFYDEDGNLRLDKNYLLGILDGNEVSWDSVGDIISKTTYRNGDIIYWKFLNDNHWIEHNGPLFKEGTVKKVYTRYGTLISEEKMLPEFRHHIKVYYEYPSGQLKQEFTSSGIGGDYMYGSFKSFFDNGRIETEGQFYEGDYLNIRTGTWKWYNEDGSINAEEIYKAEVKFWPNEKMKVAGGYIFDNESSEWLKTGCFGPNYPSTK